MALDASLSAVQRKNPSSAISAPKTISQESTFSVCANDQAGFSKGCNFCITGFGALQIRYRRVNIGHKVVLFSFNSIALAVYYVS